MNTNKRYKIMLSENVRELQNELDYRKRQLDTIDRFNSGDLDFKIEVASYMVSIDIKPSDLVDGFVEKKEKELKERISIIEDKISRIKEVIVS